MADEAVTVRDEPDSSRYEAELGGSRAGVLSYERRQGTVVLLHTQVDDEHEGEGVGSDLARFALDDARQQGLAVDAQCSFVRGWVDRHPDYADLLVDRG